MTANNLKILEASPGPTDFNPKQFYPTKGGTIAPIHKTKPRVEQLSSEPILLYPNYHMVKPNHSPSVLYRPKHIFKEGLLEDLKSEASFASTAPTSTLSKSAVSIAPLQYSKLSDR